MSHAVFVHRPDTPYDDLPDKHYHFPRVYLSRVQQTVGDQIIYYGPLSGRIGRYYVAVATVHRIRQDESRADHYYADVSDYIDFPQPVDYRADGGYERRLIGPDGRVNGGTAQSAVRLIEPNEFSRILEAGLSGRQDWLPRFDSPDSIQPGFAEEQTPFVRATVKTILNRKLRDAKFRLNVLTAYDRTCALTGLRLINGLGRPEVEAAHIVPVERNGTDSVRNGIALSGTCHWMFDRGLLSLRDDYSIIASRHLNHDVSNLLRKNMQAVVPEDERLRPHPEYLKWHRDNCLKE